MIKAGKFGASLRQVEKVFNEVDLLQAMNSEPRYPSDMATNLRSKKYREAFQTCLDNQWYDVLLADSCFIQFHRTEEKLSYCFLDVPFLVLSFEEFAAQRLDMDWWEVNSDVREDLEPDLRNDYDQYLSSDLAERSVTPIRYDYEPKLYRSGLHPAGHIHFGLQNEIRVCAKRVMNPLSFALFILRQCYPGHWEKLLRRTDTKIFREVREKLDAVPAKFMKVADHYEMHLE